jgi:hypothetical protein
MSFLHVNMVQSPMPSERQNIPKQEPLGTPKTEAAYSILGVNGSPSKSRNSRSPRKSVELQGTDRTDLII